jgi:predicted transcriptional regulator
MPATTLKLSPELKKRIASLAEKHGKSPHAFMVQALEQQAAMAEQRAQFVASALAARKNFERTGKAYDLDDVRRYILARAAGRRVRKPRLKRWRD